MLRDISKEKLLERQAEIEELLSQLNEELAEVDGALERDYNL